MRRALVLLAVALAALAAGCGGRDGRAGRFATGDEPLDVELGPERTVEDGVVVRQVVYRSGEDRVGGYLVAPAAGRGAAAGRPLPPRRGRRPRSSSSTPRCASPREEGRGPHDHGAVAAASHRRTGQRPRRRSAGSATRSSRDVVAARRGLDLLADDDRVDRSAWASSAGSMGGRLATIVAGVDDRVRAAVLMSTGAVPVAEYVAAAPEELRDDVEAVLPEIDPLSYVDDIQGALLVQAGRADSVVPQRRARGRRRRGARRRDRRVVRDGPRARRTGVGRTASRGSPSGSGSDPPDRATIGPWFPRHLSRRPETGSSRSAPAGSSSTPATRAGASAPGRRSVSFTGKTEWESDALFPMLGVNLAVLEPGQANSIYHWETETGGRSSCSRARRC